MIFKIKQAIHHLILLIRRLSFTGQLRHPALLLCHPEDLPVRLRAAGRRGENRAAVRDRGNAARVLVRVSEVEEDGVEGRDAHSPDLPRRFSPSPTLPQGGGSLIPAVWKRMYKKSPAAPKRGSLPPGGGLGRGSECLLQRISPPLSREGLGVGRFATKKEEALTLNIEYRISNTEYRISNRRSSLNT